MLLGLDAPIGLLGGTTSLVGGHGTAIAWTPVYRDDYGIGNASEIGLVLASLMGGPIANILIRRNKLEEQLDVGAVHGEENRSVNMYSVLSTWFF